MPLNISPTRATVEKPHLTKMDTSQILASTAEDVRAAVILGTFEMPENDSKNWILDLYKEYASELGYGYAIGFILCPR